MANSNNIKIIISADDKASKPLRQVANEVDKTSGATKKFNDVLKTGVKVAVGAAVVGYGAMTAGLISASKASYEQVKAVEEARFGLVAYEKDASKVNKVLDGLVAYAKSDMGVLFNRKDMFAAASTLKMYGNETDTLTERVKILSKGVAQGKTTFQELSAIVGRAAAKGRLDAVDFDMLIERGIGLDRKFRGAKVSAEDLWKELNRALPDKLLAGRADTIEGRVIRLQSAWRGLGDQVLGVDSKTSQFIKGGLGDRIQKGIGDLTNFLRTAAPVVGDSVKNIIGSFDLLTTGNYRDGLFAAGVEKDSEFIRVLQGIRDTGKQVFDYLGPKFADFGKTLREDVGPAAKILWQDVLAPLAQFLGATLVVGVGAVVDVLNLGARAFSWLVTEIKNGNPFIIGLAGAFGTLAAAMAFNAIFNALTVGFATFRLVTIPSALTSIGLLKTAITTPIVMPAIAIAAALGAIATVWQKYNEMMAAIQEKDRAVSESMRVNTEAQAVVNKAYKDGKISREQWERTIKQMTGQAVGGGRATGTNSDAGGWRLVGEHGPEMMRVPQGSQITPAYRTREEGGLSKHVEVNIGEYHVHHERDEKKFWDDIGFELENAS